MNGRGARQTGPGSRDDLRAKAAGDAGGGANIPDGRRVRGDGKGENRTVNKNDLIASVAEQAKLSRKDSERAVNAVVDTIQKALARGDKVSLVGFGTFEVRQRRARTGRNPQTGEPVRIPATRVPSFKAGKGLKEAIGK